MELIILVNACMIIFVVLLSISWKYRNKFSTMLEQYASITTETFIIVKLSTQMSLSLIFEVWVHLMSSIFFGRLPNSKQALAVSSIATSFMYITNIVWSWGFTNALWTLVPQAVGAKQIHLLALYFQRATLICFTIQIPLSFILFYGGNILDFAGFSNDKDVTPDMINKYCRSLIPYPYFMIILSCIHRIEQNLNYNFQMMLLQGITFFLSIPLHYIFITTFNFGYIGGGLVNSLNLLLALILNALFLIHKGYGFVFKPLPFYQIVNKNGLFNYLNLAWPNTIKIALEWTLRHSVIMFNGYIPANNRTVSVSASAIMKNLNYVGSFYCGCANASAVRIGKYIGSNKILHAKRCIKIQICIATILIVIVSIVFISNKHKLALIFTNDNDVTVLVSNLIYIGLFKQITWAIHKNGSTIYKSIGYQKYNTYLTFVSQYLIAIPLELYLLFVVYNGNKEIGIYIIWLGQGFGYLVADIFIVFLLMFYIDWHNVVKDKNMRIISDNYQLEKLDKFRPIS